MYRRKKQLCAVLNSKIPGKLTYINDVGSYEINYIVEDISFKDRVEEIQDCSSSVILP